MCTPVMQLMQVHARSLAHIIPGNMPRTLWNNLVPLMEVVIALSGRVLLILFTKKMLPTVIANTSDLVSSSQLCM